MLWATVAFGQALSGLGCATLGPSLGLRHEAVTYPGWIRTGSTLARSPGPRAIWGLGEVRGIRNVALARATADNRARAEVARLLAAYLVTWVQKLPPGTEPDAVVLQKLLTAKSLSGTQVVEHWFHPHDGSVFSLARLDHAAIVQALEAFGTLSPDVRAALRGQSEPVFDALAGRLAHDATKPEV